VIGEFYVTGLAGEGGQPGDWLIRWEVQNSAGAHIQTIEQRFQVLDAVAVSPRDGHRVNKHGWE